MKVYSNELPKEFEFLKGGILVRWNIEETPTEEMPRQKQYDEIKVELTDSKEDIISKLTEANYNGDVNLFVEKVLEIGGEVYQKSISDVINNNTKKIKELRDNIVSLEDKNLRLSESLAKLPKGMETK